MIKFTKIHIQNYYSISDITINLTNGISKVYGVNLDVGEDTDSSNGLGKSSLLTAIYQGLYNKNPKNPKGVISESYNKVSGLPYTITIYFSKDKVNYIVTNDRALNAISISEAGIDISKKGIKNQLTQVENIIGLDYASFSALTFLSQTTVSSVFDLTNDSNILYRFFEIEKLKLVEKELKIQLKEYKTQQQISLANISAIDKTINTLTGFTKVDVNALQVEKNSIQSALSLLLTDTKQVEIDSLLIEQAEIKITRATLSGEINLLRNEHGILKGMLTSFNTGECPTCKQDTKGLASSLDTQLDDISTRGKNKNLEVKKEETKLAVLTAKIVKLEAILAEDRDSLTTRLRIVDSKLLVVAERMKDYNKIKATTSELTAEKGIHILKIAELKEYQSFITAALGVIKSGTVTKEYITNFILLLNSKIKGIIRLVKLPLLITTGEDKGKLTYSFTNTMGDEIDYASLSSGEKTRVSLVTLVAIISTLESLTGINLNYIVYDELLSVLDKQGLKVFKQILESYRESKNVFVVIHHDEIDETFFDKELYLLKKKGLTLLQER